MDDDPPFDDDPQWRVVRDLADAGAGKVTIRPLVADDREELRRAFRATSARTRYMRFLGVVGDLDDAMLDYLTRMDQKGHVALVATLPSPDLKSERGIGVARFVRTGATVAEAAITVVDDMQRRGVGGALAKELARAARARGVRSFRAEVLADNAAMRAILEHAGARRGEAQEGTGVVVYDVDLEPERASERITKVLRGAAETMAMVFGAARAASVTSASSDAASATTAREDGADDGERDGEDAVRGRAVRGRASRR